MLAAAWVGLRTRVFARIRGLILSTRDDAAEREATPALVLDDDLSRLLVGAALVRLFIDWNKWCHRRVDSIYPLDGDQGRRKQSIDCTPPPDPRLLVSQPDRSSSELQEHHGQMVLPIALVKKGSLRQFDAQGADGSPLPILSSEEIASYELDMLQNMLSVVDEVTLLPGWRENLRSLLGSGTKNATSLKMQVLLNYGEWEGKQIWDAQGPQPRDFAKLMIRNFASHFLLLATISSRAAGVRQVLKYSYHWDLDESEHAEKLKAPFLAVGYVRRITVPADQPAAARSYHLEFHTQHEFECPVLALPPADGHAIVSDGHIDTRNKPMAHAHAAYDQNPASEPYIDVRLPARGLWLSTSLAALFTSAVFGGIQYIEFAKHWWLNAPEAAAALLIAAPAVFFGLVASGREHRLVRHALGFLRGTLLFCAASLFVLATSIVGNVRPDVMEIALPTMCWILFALTGYLVIGRLGFWLYMKRKLAKL